MKNELAPAKRRRPLIGIMSGSFHTDYSRLITEVIRSGLEEDNVDLCLFQWLDANRHLGLQKIVDSGFDGHYYSQFEYSKFLCPDILIVSFGTISSIPKERMTLEDFLASLPKVPVILLETETDLPGVLTVTVDNYTSMHEVVDHLIEDHGLKEILFLSGPQGIQDAEIRKAAYLDAMGEHDLPVDDSMIVYGDFTDLVEDRVEELLASHPRPEAIVCANDEMADCTYKVLRRHGLRPGVDVAVTGFDDIESASILEPPLTTVSQDFTAMAEAAVGMVRALLRGEQPSSLKVPLTVQYRASCGCPHKAAAPSRPEVQPLNKLQSRARIKRLVYDNVTTALLLRNLLVENISVHTFFRILGNILYHTGSPWSCVGLLKAPLTIDRSARTFVPDEIRLHLLQEGEKIEAWSRLEAPILRAGEVPFFWPEKIRYPIAVFPLFFGDVHYGVLLAQVPPENMLFLYNLSLELGTALRYLYLALDHQEAQAALEEANTMLSYSASHDGLTGLLNRTGFLSHYNTFLRQYDKSTRFVAVMADLDHLKQINDSFGHDMGDKAITMAAEILQRGLPPASPLGRTGGDEFTALFVEHEGCTQEEFIEHIRYSCEGYNRHSGLPFLVSLSVGCFPFTADQATDGSALLKKADEQLYRAKADRPASVLRPSAEE